MMGLLFLVQLILVALVAYLMAGGGYRFLYVVFKTARRDLLALSRYLWFLWSVRTYSSADASVADIFREQVKKNPNKVLLVLDDREWTAAQKTSITWSHTLFCILLCTQSAAAKTTTANWPRTVDQKMKSKGTVSFASSNSTYPSTYYNYKQDLLVVLPVMQGSSDYNNSNLEMWYTKRPVTALINEEPIRSPGIHNVRSATTAIGTSTFASATSATTTASPTNITSRPAGNRLQTKSISAATPILSNSSPHPYTDFLRSTKPIPLVRKSPLDYGYPNNLKFVEELNELPRNHKPEWAQSGNTTNKEIKKIIKTENLVKHNPFRMFESVKPSEINKLLTHKPFIITVSDNVPEETAVNKNTQISETTNTIHKQPIPPARRIKNPQKITHIQKLGNISHNALLSPSTTTSTTNVVTTSRTVSVTTSIITKLPSTATPPKTTFRAVTNPTTTKAVSTPSNQEVDSELYNAARFSTLFAESTREFLPTPGASSTTFHKVYAPLPPANTKSTAAPQSPNNWLPMTTFSTASSPPTTTTSSQSTSLPNAAIKFKPLELISFTKMIDENLDSKNTLVPSESSKNTRDPLVSHRLIPTTTTPPSSSLSVDMLSNEMKNMLIGLGILRSENNSLPLLFPDTSATTTPANVDQQLYQNLFVQQEPVVPVVDPNSFVSFKKLPTEVEQSQVSNDMRDLFSSFGLLPAAKSTNDLRTNSLSTRVSRQQKMNDANVSMEILDHKMSGALKNISLLKPSATSNQSHSRNEHVFQPSNYLENLADRQQVEKINSVLETLRNLSKSKDAENLSIEELELKIRNVTVLLEEENLLVKNLTETRQSVTEPSSTENNFIFYKRVTSAKTKNGESKTTVTPSIHNIVNITSSITSNRFTTTENYEIHKNHTGTVDANNVRNKSTNANDSMHEGFESTRSDNITATSASTVATSMATSTENNLEVNNSSTSNGKITSTTAQLPIADSSTEEEHSDVLYIKPEESSISVVKSSSLPPNPLSVEELQNLLESNRNEVKRQQPEQNGSTVSHSVSDDEKIGNQSSNNVNGDGNTSNRTTEETTTKVDESDSNNEDNNAPLEALEDSFGGESESEQQQGNSWSANAKPNGLYFLLDWNTFLSVGEEDKNPIRIRFSPRAGNPRHFLPIKVP